METQISLPLISRELVEAEPRRLTFARSLMVLASFDLTTLARWLTFSAMEPHGPTRLAKVRWQPHLGLVAVVALQAFAPSLTFGQTVQSSRIVVDGTKNPERIPEWFRWEKILTLGGEARLLEDPPAPDLISPRVLLLSPPDRAALQQAAAAHSQRRKEHDDRVRQAGEAFDRRNIKPEELVEKLYAHLFALELEYRHVILASRAELLQTLSVEGQLAVSNWIAEVVKSVKLFLDPLDAKRFAQPQ